MGVVQGRRGRRGEGVHPPAVVEEAAYVDLRDGQPRGEAALRQKGPVLGDHVVAGEDHVRGGFPLPGVGIDVAAAEPAGLPPHQLPAVGGLAHHLVGGGEVQNHRRPRPGQGGGGGLRGPEVLADLHANHQARQGIALQDHAVGEVDILLAGQGHQGVHALPGGEPALLIELPVVGDIGLGDQTQDLSSLYDSGAIVQLVVPFVPHRQTDGREDIQVFRGLQDGPQALPGPVQEGVLKKEVGAGVAGQAQLRQYQEFYPLPLGLSHHGENLFRVVPAVGDLDLRRTGSGADESVLHKVLPPLSSFCGFVGSIVLPTGVKCKGRLDGLPRKRPGRTLFCLEQTPPDTGVHIYRPVDSPPHPFEW